MLFSLSLRRLRGLRLHPPPATTSALIYVQFPRSAAILPAAVRSAPFKSIKCVP
ncbi:uncharacterized protein DS421_3g104230 [Arachis hypogaea]|nr:uncharacterized protein DS421_3g104230 [Arachis hypogaea]